MSTLWRAIKALACGIVGGIVLILTILGFKNSSQVNSKLKELKKEETSLKDSINTQEEDIKKQEEVVAQDREEIQTKYEEQNKKIEEIQNLKEAKDEKIDNELVTKDDIDYWLKEKGLKKDEPDA